MPVASPGVRHQVDTAQFPVEMAVLTAGLGCSSGDEPFGVVYAIPAADQTQREPWQYVSYARAAGWRHGGVGSQDGLVVPPSFSVCSWRVGLGVGACGCGAS